MALVDVIHKLTWCASNQTAWVSLAPHEAALLLEALPASEPAVNPAQLELDNVHPIVTVRDPDEHCGVVVHIHGEDVQGHSV